MEDGDGAVRVSGVGKEGAGRVEEVGVGAAKNKGKEKIPQDNTLTEELCRIKEIFELVRERTFQMWIDKNKNLVVKFTEMKDIQELLKLRAGRLAAPIGHYPTHIDQALEKPSHLEQSHLYVYVVMPLI